MNIKRTLAIVAIAAVSSVGLAACGTKTKTVVVHDKVTVPAPAVTTAPLPPVAPAPVAPAPTPAPAPVAPTADNSAGNWDSTTRAQFEQGFFSTFKGDHTLGTCLVGYVEDNYSVAQVESPSFDMTAVARAAMNACTSQSA